jgi:DNA-binding FrmR family transcriptional regulator
MKTIEQRLNNIIGQLEGVKKRLDTDSDCLDYLIQLKAARAAISSLMRQALSEEFGRCLSGLKMKKRQQIEKLLDEISKN